MLSISANDNGNAYGSDLLRRSHGFLVGHFVARPPVESVLATRLWVAIHRSLSRVYNQAGPGDTARRYKASLSRAESSATVDPSARLCSSGPGELERSWANKRRHINWPLVFLDGAELCGIRFCRIELAKSGARTSPVAPLAGCASALPGQSGRCARLASATSRAQRRPTLAGQLSMTSLRELCILPASRSLIRFDLCSPLVQQKPCSLAKQTL